MHVKHAALPIASGTRVVFVASFSRLPPRGPSTHVERLLQWLPARSRHGGAAAVASLGSEDERVVACSDDEGEPSSSHEHLDHDRPRPGG